MLTLVVMKTYSDENGSLLLHGHLHITLEQPLHGSVLSSSTRLIRVYEATLRGQ